jgi:hypothetical protein
MMDILTQINISRSGDLITADNEFCYLFLNACPQTVLLVTLERLLHRSVETALNDVRFVLQRAEINAELAALSRAASRGTLPDYSSISEAPQPTESPVTEKVEAKPVFKQAASGLQIAATPQTVAVEPISSLLSAWAPNESRTRTAQDPPVKPQPDRPTVAPQARPVPASSTQVFGKREAPRATRSVPPGNSRGTP